MSYAEGMANEVQLGRRDFPGRRDVSAAMISSTLFPSFHPVAAKFSLLILCLQLADGPVDAFFDPNPMHAV